MRVILFAVQSESWAQSLSRTGPVSSACFDFQKFIHLLRLECIILTLLDIE